MKARREPIFVKIPVVGVGLALCFAAAHLWRIWGGDEQAQIRFLRLACIPAVIRGDVPIPDFLRTLPFPAGGPQSLWTYAFVHAGFQQVFFSGLWAIIFDAGSVGRLRVEARAGLFALGTLCGALAYVCLMPQSAVPLIGARAGTGALSAAALYVMFPGTGFVVISLLWLLTDLLPSVLPFFGPADPTATAHVAGYLVGALAVPFLIQPKKGQA